jgi:hypothetical protein
VAQFLDISLNHSPGDRQVFVGNPEEDYVVVAAVDGC